MSKILKYIILHGWDWHHFKTYIVFKNTEMTVSEILQHMEKENDNPIIRKYLFSYWNK